MALGDWGWSEDWAYRLSALGDDLAWPARVSSQERTVWTIQTEHGPRQARMPASGFGDGLPVVGDWVVAVPGDEQSDPWLIRGVLPRRSKFSRKVAGQRTEEQIVAANVDRVWIVHGLDIEMNPRRLERYLAVAWESGAQPELVLSKADIAVNLDEARGVAAEVAFGVPIWIVNITDLSGCEELAHSLVAGTTVALLGPSGVGKSSLVNRLAGSEVLQTGEVRSGAEAKRGAIPRLVGNSCDSRAGPCCSIRQGCASSSSGSSKPDLPARFPRSKDWPTAVDSGTANTSLSRDARYLLGWLQARSAVQGLTATGNFRPRPSTKDGSRIRGPSQRRCLR